MSHSVSAALVALLNDGAPREMNVHEMETWGEALARSLPRPCRVTLSGDLGAGKTTLARALCRGFGVVDLNAVTSPTFSILQDYVTADGAVMHADLYRLQGDVDLDALGWEEIVETAAVLLVEWPERTVRPWPAGTLQVTLAYGNAALDSRTLAITRV